MRADIEALLPAWHSTRYRVWLPWGAVDLRLDQNCPRLDEWLDLNKVDNGAFITACNPACQALSADDNARRMAALDQAIRDGGWPALLGLGLPEQPNWSAEPSRLLLNLPLPKALDLAEGFGQYALVWHAPGQASRLQLTRLCDSHR